MNTDYNSSFQPLSSKQTTEYLEKARQLQGGARSITDKAGLEEIKSSADKLSNHIKEVVNNKLMPQLKELEEKKLQYSSSKSLRKKVKTLFVSRNIKKIKVLERRLISAKTMAEGTIVFTEKRIELETKMGIHTINDKTEEVTIDKDDLTALEALGSKPLIHLLNSPDLKLNQKGRESALRLVKMHSRASTDNSITYQDVKALQNLQSHLQALNPSADVNQMRELVEDMQNAIKTAMEVRVKLLKDPDTTIMITKLSKLSISDKKLTNDDTKELVLACHNLYWDFNNPYETQIDMRDFAAILDQLDQFSFLGDIKKEDLESIHFDAHFLADHSVEIKSYGQGKNNENLSRYQMKIAGFYFNIRWHILTRK